MKTMLWVVLPLILLGGLVAGFLIFGVPGMADKNLPPIERVFVERTELLPDKIILHFLNDGPDPVRIAQVQVNEAYWNFEIEPREPLPRLGRGTITVSYPWEAGEPVIIVLVTSTGVLFETIVEVASRTPEPGLYSLGFLGLLGFFIGIVPVFLGMMWLPFLRKLGENWYRFLLALTVGLLAFLGVDSLVEAVETGAGIPGSFHSDGVIAIGFFSAFLGIFAINRAGRKVSSAPDSMSPGMRIATGIAVGIGIHNLGEGLAVGGAYAVGNISLGALLVIGFMLHNLTEGVAVVSPVTKESARFSRLVLLGVIAGGPAVLGAWFGGFAYSAFWATLFLAIGAGAIFQVFVEIVSFMGKKDLRGLLTPLNVSGFVGGMVIMYLTALLVTA